jgi:dihydrofolate synthase / folylpolyglutamate synthase
MIRTYGEAVKYIESYIPTPERKHPGDIGIKRMKLLMKELGDPQFQYQTVHVGGTSGKGSTATMIASILATQMNVGLHTSPHLVKVNERISTFGNHKGSDLNKIKGLTPNSPTPISDNEFIRLVNQIRPHIESVSKAQYGKLTYFEITTAMAFLFFATMKVDIAVIEVGMGGRYDATNVLHPLVAVLTNVGHDHTEVLGNTVEEIASEKVGIIQSGIAVVSGVKQSSVKRIVEEVCATQGASFSFAGQDFSSTIRTISQKGSVFDYCGNKTIKNLHLSLLGEHQIENAALAIRAIEKLSVIGYRLSVRNIRLGLYRANIPGRLEIIHRNPTVILDGAHNPDKMRALVRAMKAIFPGVKVSALIAIKKEKNAHDMLRELLPICKCVVCTQYKVKIDVGNIVSYEPADMIKIIHSIDPTVKSSIMYEPRQAYQRVLSEPSSGTVLITGSLYLIGDIRTRI